MATMGVSVRRPRVRLARVLPIAFVLYAIYAAFLWSVQRSILFPRAHASMPAFALKLVPGAERWTTPTRGGDVGAFFLPGDGASATHPRPAVFFAHGNAELADEWIQPLTAYQRLGVSVLVAEFPGYGRSAGEPTQDDIGAVFLAFHDRLAARPEVDRTRLILHGRSIGGGAIGQLAKARPPAALILQSTFRSVRAMASKFLVPGFLVRDPFDTEAVLRTYDGPVFIIHGTHDALIPFENGEALARAAKHVLFVSYDADHNDCPPDWGEYMSEVAGFLREARIL